MGKDGKMVTKAQLSKEIDDANNERVVGQLTLHNMSMAEVHKFSEQVV